MACVQPLGSAGPAGPGGSFECACLPLAACCLLHVATTTPAVWRRADVRLNQAQFPRCDGCHRLTLHVRKCAKVWRWARVLARRPAATWNEPSVEPMNTA